MKNKFSFYILILVLTVFLSQKGQASALNSSGSCDKFKDQMKDAINRIDKMFAQQDAACLPADLESIIKDRLNAPIPISIQCNEKKPGRWEWIRDRCTFRVERKWVEREGGVQEGSYKTLSIYGADILSNADLLTEKLFHELIHISENYYSKNHNITENRSSDDYTYMCTKQCFPNAPNCPGAFNIKCKECNKYKKPGTK